MAETRRVRDLAQMIADKTGAPLSYVNNPRNEAAENELEVTTMEVIDWCVVAIGILGRCVVVLGACA